MESQSEIRKKLYERLRDRSVETAELCELLERLDIPNLDLVSSGEGR